jgi:Fe2+ transport system protein FeoA
MEMGCVPGELVKVEQIAPLGDPISITVAGYNLSLRLDEAENIFMEDKIQ